jgi:hypothetical protein
VLSPEVPAKFEKHEMTEPQTYTTLKDSSLNVARRYHEKDPYVKVKRVRGILQLYVGELVKTGDGSHLETSSFTLG